jgi:transcriptional regulator with XRE-family HTH domain
MRSPYLTSDEREGLDGLARRIRLARLRRNLSQETLADRAGVTRKTVIALEQGSGSVTLAVLAKVLGVLGYPGRLGDLLAADPIGEDLEMAHGRRRAGSVGGVADF